MAPHGRKANDTLDELARTALHATEGVLARVWRPGPGDRCASCPMAGECRDRTWCLHLAAAAGLDARVEGRFARFPRGARDVGRVPELRTPLVLAAGLRESGLADPRWLDAHRVACFVAVPIPWPDGRCGVLGLFARRPLGAGDVALLALAARWAGEACAIEARGSGGASPATAPDTRPGPADASDAPLRPLAETERAAIEAALRHTAGRVSGPRGAAAILGLKPTTLESRIKKHGIRKPRP